MTKVAASHRRAVLMGLGGLGVSGLAACATPAIKSTTTGIMRPRFVSPPLAPVNVRPDRITRMTVCLRPFRAMGPRMDVETIGDKRVVHNYGHGGSGWSLSWGSARIAVEQAMQDGTRDVAVIGCGAIGLTTATLLQRAGAKVTIYASERLPQTRSARATGLWTPDSRIADLDRVDPTFPSLWEKMARASWAMHQTYVGQPGEPVAFLDRYIIEDEAVPPTPRTPRPPAEPHIRFAEYGDRLDDIVPTSHELNQSQHPFSATQVRVGSSMQFNVAELGHRLMTDFIAEGGRIETRTFHTPADLAGLSEPVVVNCTGYGARFLFGDDGVVPVRGQMIWLPPQPEVRYSLYYHGVGMVSRPDGIGLQWLSGGDMLGLGDTDETPRVSEAQDAIDRLAGLYRRAGVKI